MTWVVQHSVHGIEARNRGRVATLRWPFVAWYLKTKPPPRPVYVREADGLIVTLRPNAVAVRFSKYGQRIVFPRGLLQRAITKCRPDLFATDKPEPELLWL